MLTSILIQAILLTALVGFVIFIAVADRQTTKERQREDEEERRRRERWRR